MADDIVNEQVALELMNMRQNNGTKRDDLLYEAAAFLKRRGYLVPARAELAAKDGAVGVKAWPFVESPELVAAKLDAMHGGFSEDMLAAVRNVFIENPPTLRSSLVSAPAVDGALSAALRENEWGAYWKDVAERALAKQHEMQAKIDHLAKQEVDIRAAYVLNRAENMQLTRENIRLDREWEDAEARASAAEAGRDAIAAEAAALVNDSRFVRCGPECHAQDEDPNCALEGEFSRQRLAAEAREAGLRAALDAMEPHVEKIARCIRINDEMGRVVTGQTEAATALKAIFEETRAALSPETQVEP